MARSRNIKPGFFTNEDLAECSTLARLLFAGLWLHADREGRMEDRPKKIKAEVLPFDNCDTDALLSELASRGFIVRYESGGVKCIWITNFKKHQRPHPNEAESDLPCCPCNVTSESGNYTSRCALPSSSLNPSSLNPSSLNPSSLNPSSSLEPLASQGDSEQASVSGRRPKDDAAKEQAAPPVMEFPCVGVKGGAVWKLLPAKLEEYQESYPGIDVLAEIRKALQWCRDNPPRRKTPKGMPAFLGRWLEKAQNERAGRGPPPAKGKAPSVDLSKVRF